MKHFFIRIPTMPADGYRAGDRIELAVEQTEDVDELDGPGCFYLGSTDDDGNPTTALDPAQRDRAEIGAMMSSIRGPYFKATAKLNDGEVCPVVVNADHVIYARPGVAGPETTWLHLSTGQDVDLTDPYPTIEAELYGVMDVDDATATA